MPGIAGVFSCGERLAANPAVIGLMTNALKHLDHQQATHYEYDNLTLGRVDLGVFARNIQARETAEIIVFLWGELSNERREREESIRLPLDGAGSLDDLDFLASVYARDGAGFPRSLRGSFNACVVDKKRRCLFVATDRLGLRPLYYSHRGDTIAFASAVRALMNSGLVGRATDLAAVADFLALGFVPGAKTMCEGIEVMPPGSVLTFERGQLRLDKYWELTFEPGDGDRRETEYVDELAEAIRSSVETSTEGTFRFGLPLSGGLDSRTIAACIPKEKYPLSVWTWGTPDSREVRTARAVTDILGLEHQSRCRTPEDFLANFKASVLMTDGMISANLPLANFLFRDTFMGKVDICLDGTQSIGAMYAMRIRATGGDTTLLDELVPSAPAEVLRLVFRDTYYRTFVELTRLTKERLRLAASDPDPVNRFQFIDLTEKQRKLDFLGHPVKRQFVEVRTPLLDYPVLDAVQRIPARLRTQRKIYYKALCRLSPDLARVPNVGTGIPVNRPLWLQMLSRARKGVTSRLVGYVNGMLGPSLSLARQSDWGIDYDSWQRHNAAIKRFTRAVLSPENVARCEYLNAQGIKQIVDETQRGGRDHVGMIYRLLTHVIWRESLG